MKYTLTLRRCGIYRGQLLNETEEVIETREIEAATTQALFSAIQALPTAHGLPETPAPQRLVHNGPATLIAVSSKTPEVIVYVTAVLFVPPPDPEVLKEQAIMQEEASLTQRVFKVWRGKLDKMKALREQAGKNDLRNAEQEAQYQQLNGSISTLSAVLTDLQRVRPVNQSAL